MAIFLSILKIIGIVLLVILLFLLVAISIILFLPVRYDMYAEYEDKLSARFYICGFSGFLRLRGMYEDGKGHLFATAFWELWQFYPQKEKKVKKQKTSKKNEKIQSDLKEKDGEAVSDIKLEDQEIIDKTSIKESSRSNKREKKKQHKKNYQGVKRSSNQKNANKKGFGYYKNEILKEENQRAFQLIINQIFGILKKVKPTVKMADITYSVGEPDLTGELTGIISLFPGAYGKRVEIYPDFLSDDPYIRGKIELTGRIHLVHIVIVAAKVFFNKDCRKLFHL